MKLENDLIPEKLKNYTVLVDFLADFLGDDTEVVLHDTQDWHNSVVAIRNGHISGRSVGAPMTDYAIGIMKEGIYRDKLYHTNYKGMTSTGHEVRSATYFIKDDDGQVIGMLCLNTDVSKLKQARALLDGLIQGAEKSTTFPIQEKFNIDVKDLVENHINILYPNGEKLSRLSKEQKIDLVKRLDELGTFMVKGAVQHVAEILGVSVSTVYRYLGTVKNADK